MAVNNGWRVVLISASWPASHIIEPDEYRGEAVIVRGAAIHNGSSRGIGISLQSGKNCGQPEPTIGVKTQRSHGLNPNSALFLDFNRNSNRRRWVMSLVLGPTSPRFPIASGANETKKIDVTQTRKKTVPSNSSKAGVSLEFRVRVAVLSRISVLRGERTRQFPLADLFRQSNGGPNECSDTGQRRFIGAAALCLP